MSYAYRKRKKAIKKLKKRHEYKLDRNQLPPDLMPENPFPPKFIGTLADILEQRHG